MSDLYINPLTSTLFIHTWWDDWYVYRTHGWQKCHITNTLLLKLKLVGKNYREHN